MAEPEIVPRKAPSVSPLWRRWPIVAALATIAAAVSPPFDAAASSSLAAHMTQHVLLLTVAPPLLALGIERAVAPTTVAFVSAALAHSAVLLGWHVPALYDAADAHLPVHLVEHVSLIGAGVGLWWAVGIASRRRPVALLALFVAGFPGIALGSAMTLSRHPWFRDYRDLTDQQIAGVVMWAGAGAFYALASGAITLAWLRREPA